VDRPLGTSFRVRLYADLTILCQLASALNGTQMVALAA